jgi:hypothetical protein
LKRRRKRRASADEARTTNHLPVFRLIPNSNPVLHSPVQHSSHFCADVYQKLSVVASFFGVFFGVFSVPFLA